MGVGRDGEPLPLFLCASVSVCVGGKRSFLGDFLCLQMLSPMRSVQGSVFIVATPCLRLCAPRFPV